MKLFQHQTDGLKQAEGKNRVALYWDMGLGKTFGGSEKMMQLGARVNLLICQKSKIADWEEHFTSHYPELIYDLTNKLTLEKFRSCVAGGAPFGKNIVGIINYELAWRRKELLNLKDFTLMLDESSLIQNQTAKQTKFVLKLQPANVILLSGTPTSGKYENLWTQAHLLGWNISETLYDRQYIERDFVYKRNGEKVLNPVTGRPVKAVVGYKNVERLKAKLREYGAQFLKTEDVMTLPEQTFVEVKVPKTKEYSKFMKNSIITINLLNLLEFHDGSDFEGRDVTPRIDLIGDTTLTKHLYARQLCGQYNADKLQAFRDLVQSTNDRLIVFYNFKEEAARLIHIANKLERPWGVISGAEKNLAAYENNDNSIVFVQYQAGAMGLNLQKANKVIYFTLPERSELFEQSKKRIHRIGQSKPCFYYILMCKNSIEGDIYEALKMRKDFTDELFKEVGNGSRKEV